METRYEYTEQNRQIAKILNLYYIENYSQAKIADKVGLSVAKVNRLLKMAREVGMVETHIRLPFPNLFDLEEQLGMLSGIDDIIVTPSTKDSQVDDLHFLTQAAASYLTEHLKQKDTICIGGGKTLSEVIHQLEPHTTLGARVYPAIGGVPRTIEGEVNGLATLLAQKLGGEAAPFFAPAFADSETERNTIIGLTHVVRSLDLASSARVGLFGIGHLQMDSSIIRYCPFPFHEISELVERSNGVGEILGYIIDSQGEACVPELCNLVIGISLENVRQIPVRIGVAAGAIKAPAIAAVIKGGYFTSLIIDEDAARPVIEILKSNHSG